MASEHGGDGVVGPHPPGLVVGERRGTCRGRPARAPPSGSALAVGPVAGEVHRQGDVPALGPELGPLAERLPAAAVDAGASPGNGPSPDSGLA